MNITRVTTSSDELECAFGRLIPQLKLDCTPPTKQELGVLLNSDACQLLIVRFPNETAPIAGVLTLIIYRVPTGVRARIEDVVVDESMRGQGIGEALVRHALNLARDAGADGASLTSNPNRKAANRLYQRLGFTPWKTNLYFYRF
jgi:ribosomal protein S18 acetylase RimI-like enzyme